MKEKHRSNNIDLVNMFKSLFSNSVIIPTLRLSGVIGQAGLLRSGLTINTIDKLINKLFSFKKSPAVALIINSPGGSPTQSSLIAERIIKNAYHNAQSGPTILMCSYSEVFNP